MSKLALTPKRRRRWLWIALMGVFVILIWWLIPRHHRINDLAASLDQSDPGWRYEEIRQSQKPPPSMEELVPSYLSRLPTNPETSGQQLIQLQSIPDGYSLETQPLRGITEKGEPFVDRLTVIRK